MGQVIPAPLAQVALATFYPAAFAASANGAVSHGMHNSRVQIVVPKPHSGGLDLDAMGHG